MSWPGAWEGTLPLREVEATFAALAAAITAHERLLLVVPESARGVNGWLARSGARLERVRQITLPTDDVWARDFGPITVQRGAQLALMDFTFNGWGGKYPASNDTAISRSLQARGQLLPRLQTIPRVLEGGSIDSDGAGTLLTTRQCLLTPTRNPDMTEADWERGLRDWFGCDRVIWLDGGRIMGDDTDGHVDMLARFAPGDTILHCTCDDPADPHYAWLGELTAELAALRTRDGRPYRLLPLPIPAAIHDCDGRRLPASYANFLIIDGAVLMPTYRAAAADAHARAVIASAFPDREVVGIDCLPLIDQSGSLHCVTMQLPRGVLPCRES